MVIYFNEENPVPVENASKPQTQEEILILFRPAGDCVNNTYSKFNLVLNNYNAFLKAVDKTSVNVLMTEEV